MDIPHLNQIYIREAQDLLNSLDGILLNMEKNTTNKEYIEQIFRVMHTLKGASGMCGFDEISELTHTIESLYELIRNNKLTITDAVVQVTFETVDTIRLLLNKNDHPYENDYHNICLLLNEKISGVIQSPYSQLKARVSTENEQSTSNGQRSWLIVFTPDESIINRGIRLQYTFQDLFRLGKYEMTPSIVNNEITQWNILLVTDKPREVIEDALLFILESFKISIIADFDVLDEQELDKRDEFITQLSPCETNAPIIQPEIKFEFKPEHPSYIKQSATKVSVDSEKLDTLIYLVSELVTSKSELLLSIEETDFEKSKSAAEKINKLSQLFRDNALSMRLVSLRDLFGRYKRLVRDLSKQLDKNVNLELVGEDTELDKNIIEALSEPMMHLIRNCIDHGIETPMERKASGKNDMGIIKITAYKKGSYVFIQISDDGKGINREKILSKAISKNIISEHQQLTDKEMYDLIFIPGFSTSESLTQVSGRGVGMDIVRNKIQEIHGEISLESEKGSGTTFTLKLQQSIAIIDTLLVSVENTKFAIPLEDIESCQLTTAVELLLRQNKHFTYKDMLIPYISIRDELKYQSPTPDKVKVIIINRHDKHYAVLVDEIIGEFQAVIKPLDKIFSNVKFLSGVSILGDGDIALLADTENLKSLIS